MRIQNSVNTLRPRQNGRHFADDIFKCIFLNENAWMSLKISLKFVPKVRINNIPALVQIMAWRRPGGKPLSEPVMVSLLTHICVTLPQWVNHAMWSTWWFNDYPWYMIWSKNFHRPTQWSRYKMHSLCFTARNILETFDGLSLTQYSQRLSFLIQVPSLTSPRRISGGHLCHWWECGFILYFHWNVVGPKPWNFQEITDIG